MTCAFHYYTPWRVARPPIVSKGWQMEGRYCDICGQRFTRRHSLVTLTAKTEKAE